MTVLLLAGCSSSSPEPPPQVGVLDGTYVASAQGGTARFTFSTANHDYSASIPAAATFTDEGSYTFDGSVLALTSTTGERTKLGVRVLRTEELTGAAPSSVRPLQEQDVLEIPSQGPLYTPAPIGGYLFHSCDPDPVTGTARMCAVLLTNTPSGLQFDRVRGP
jgi:hypothetical protein